jgi:hypothetical protein
MEEAMRKEHRDLVQNLNAALIRLFPCGRNADNDVAESVAGELGELALLHREREHVGRTIFMTIDLVQLMDAIVVS